MPAAKPQPLADLKSWGRNPRRIRPERLQQLARSMAADPAMMDARPLVALPDGTVIMGNQRLAAARSLGWKRIPTLTVDLDEETAASWAFRDNQSYGEWEDELVAEMLAGMQQDGADLDLTGFEGREVGAYLDSLAAPTGVDDAPPLPKGKPRSKLGEVYELGAHRLLCGDATSPDAVTLIMAGDMADLVVTSPPYNQGLDAFKPSGMQAENPAWVHRMADAYADSMPEDAYQDQQVAMLDGLLPHIADNGAAFYNHKVRYREMQIVHPMSWITRSSWRVRQEIVWDRASSITLNARMFMPIDERVYWLTKSRRFVWNDASKTDSTIWRITPRAEAGVTAPFPVELPTRCIRAATRRGGTVLDPYAGSGTTLIAAETLGRRCFAMEIDPAYCDVIRERYARFVEGSS